MTLIIRHHMAYPTTRYLVQLACRVKRNHRDASRGSCLQLRRGLAGVGVDEVFLGVCNKRQHLLNLCQCRTVKTSAQGGKGCHESRVRVALDSIHGPHSRKVGGPRGVQTGNCTEVDDVKGVVEGVGIDEGSGDGLGRGVGGDGDGRQGGERGGEHRGGWRAVACPVGGGGGVAIVAVVVGCRLLSIIAGGVGRGAMAWGCRGNRGGDVILGTV